MGAFPAFVGGSYQSQSPVSDAATLINWYVEPLESEGATARTALYPTPGVRSFAEVTAAGGRGMFADGTGRVFAIFGTSLYEITSAGVVFFRGTVAADDNPATFSSNGDDQLFITSGDRGYCYVLSMQALTQVLASGATMGGFSYGYFIAFDRATPQIRISDLFNGLVWDPTQFAQRTIGADPWRAMLVTPYGQIALLGNKTSEFWYNSGAFPFPFQPDPSGLMEEGIAATFSAKQAGKSAVWLSQNTNGGYQVLRASGFTPERISNHALEYAIAGYADIDDAIAETYEDRGHAFYLLTFPTSKITWAYDFTTGQWARRGTWIVEASEFDYWRPVFHCFGFNKHLVADRLNSVIYEMSDTFGLDVESRPIRRVRQTPATTNEHQRLFFDSLELLMEVGVGVSTGAAADVDPQVMLRVSNDFGQTWGAERAASAGKIGEYWRRVKWWALGSGRGRRYEVSVTAAVPWRITGAFQGVRASREAA